MTKKRKQNYLYKKWTYIDIYAYYKLFTIRKPSLRSILFAKLELHNTLKSLAREPKKVYSYYRISKKFDRKP